MRYTTFSKHIAQLADAVNVQDLLEQLAEPALALIQKAQMGKFLDHAR